MFSIAHMRITRTLTSVLPALLLAGCFGQGEGPTPIAGTPAPPPPEIPEGFCDPINFEDPCGPFVFNEFEGGLVTIIDNPDVNALNPTDKVARMQKFAAESGKTFGGSTLALPSGMDFSNGEAFRMLVWSSRPVPVLFKFEGLNQEREVDHSGSGAWEELCFDFTGSTDGPLATGITFIFDVTVLGDATNDPDNWTFFFDEITQHESCGGGGPPPSGSAPTTSAPTPTQDAANVISLFSDAYTDEAVVWPTDWSVPNNTTSDVTIDGGLVKEALDISFFGIEFQVDATSMTHVHFDVWTPDATSLLFRLVDFGGDGFGGGNDTEADVTLDAASTPALVQGSWVSVDIPLQTFLDNGLASVADLNQIVVDPGPDGTDLYIDNVYFYDDNAGGGGTAPTTSAPTPTQDAANVISLYSDAYTDVATTWPTPWSDPNNTTSDVTIDGGLVKEHLAINFVGVEFQVDATSMTHVHFDVWTPDATSLLFRLVDFGGDGFGGGNDTQADVTLDAASTPALVQGSWVSVDIPLQTFLDNGLASVADLNQIVLDPPDGTTVYIDNVYFYDDNAGGGGTAPTTSAPTPTQDAANVISLYSDAYTDVATTWPTPWSDPNNTTSDVTIDGGLVKEHLAINFVGVEFQVDATSMTHVHFDVWTPDATSLLFRLVDFGGDGFGGGNDTQADVTLDAASTPALVQGSWVSVDIPLQTFLDNGLASVADLNQIVLDPPDGTTVYIDNVYFYSDTPPTSPTTSAPTPTQDAANVISLYSDAYTDVATTWPTPWSDPNNTTSDVTIDGGLVKEHLAINFVGVEFQVDATSMTHVHFDVWTPDATSLLFRLVDFGGDGFGGGNDTQADVTLDAASTPALVQGSWVSVDIPLQTFLDNGLASVADLNQIVLDPPDGTTVYIDNVYFYDANAGGGTGGTFVNGDFETGDFTGWTLTQIPDTRGSITLDSSGLGGRAGTVARLVAAGDATGTNDVLISQVALAAGTIVAGDTIDVSFDLYGSLTGAGGVVFVEVIFLNGAGLDEGGRDFVGPAAPYTPTTTWTNYSGSVTAGTAVDGTQWDVSGGVTLQLKAACGAIAGGCGVDAAFDNVTFTINGP